MTMKKITSLKFWLMAMFIAMFTMSLVSCSSDDNNGDGTDDETGQIDETGLVGTWKGQYEEKGMVYNLTICFNTNNTGWDTFGGNKETFTWFTEGEKLTVVYPGEKSGFDEDEYIYKIAGKQLYLYWFDSITGEKELECVLTRQ